MKGDRMTDVRPQKEVGAHPLLYVLTLLVVLNLVVTAWIALHYVRTPRSTKELPATVEQIREEVAARIVDAYNRRDFSSLYDVFDPYARAQLSEEGLTEPFRKSRDALGEITSTEFSHHAFVGRQRDRDWYELHYRMELYGGKMNSGSLKITVGGNGDSFGIMRIDLRSD